MCGILGVIATTPDRSPLNDAQLARMRDAMASRGPDASGVFRRRHVAFAHRRLAIRDLQGGNQPLLSADGQIALVYNGELYNDQPLRKELTDAGYEFRDQCDTEVVLAAYRQWKADSLRRLRGMFAFGIYDFRDDSLLLARDRLGIKPLFLSEVDGQILFASSIAALLAHPRIEKQPNLSVLSHYLSTLRLTLGRQTLYEGIWQLLPGEVFQWCGGKSTTRRYWNYPTQEDDRIDYTEAVGQLHLRLDDSVAVHLVSDVPVGMFLSGGVDSNTLACLLQRQRSRLSLASCGVGATEPNEDLSFARACAAHHQIAFSDVRVSNTDYKISWEFLIRQQRTPLSTPSDVILYELAREMKKSVGVVLGGEGADELLCGYPVQHWAGRDLESTRLLAQGSWSFGSQAAEVFLNGIRQQYGRDSFVSETDHYFALNSLIPTPAKRLLWQSWAWQRAEEDQRMWSYYTSLFGQLEGMCTLRKYCRLLHFVNLEALLARLDSSTMQAGLEARVPYADHVLVEQMFRLPHSYKIDVSHEEQEPYLPSGLLQARGTLRSKRLLRSLAGELLPAPLATRRKASFPTPVQAWLSGPWRDWATRQLRQSPFAQALFEPRALDELTTNVPQAGMWLWPLLNISLWGDQEFAERN